MRTETKDGLTVITFDTGEVLAVQAGCLSLYGSEKDWWNREPWDVRQLAEPLCIKLRAGTVSICEGMLSVCDQLSIPIINIKLEGCHVSQL